MSGYLKVYCGPMFSDKSSSLVKDISQMSDIDEKTRCLIINHSLDTRDVENGLSSHSSLYTGVSKNITVVQTAKILDIDVSDFDVIGIDEATFFDDLPEAVQVLLSLDKYIIVSGIDSDFRGNKIGKISDILHMSDEFIKLRSYCAICLKENKQSFRPNDITRASFTSKINNSGGQIDIGGSEKYFPTCRFHHKQLL